MLSKHLINLAAALIVLLAAVIFAGAMLWGNVSRSPSSGSGALSPLVVADALGADSAIPHYPTGGVVGRVTSVSGQTVMVSVIPPGLSKPPSDAVLTTVLIDSDTDIYQGGGLKDEGAYQKETAAYAARHEPGEIAPDPFTHEKLKISDISVGMTLSITPKAGSANGTTLHAASIVPFAVQASP